jgi:hypothetical protein
MEVDPIIWPKILQVMLVESNRSNHLAEIRKPHPNLCFPRTVKKSVYQSVLELGRQKKTEHERNVRRLLLLFLPN